MIVVVLILCCYAFASVYRWNATTDGFWTDGNNWETGIAPSKHSFAYFPPQTSPLTVIVQSKVLVSSLTLSSNVELLFRGNSTLTVSDSLIINGGSLSTESSSRLSFTSVDFLIVDSDHVSLFSHKLIVTRLFDWKRCSIDLDGSSELVLVNVTSRNDAESRISSDVLHVWGWSGFGNLGGELSGSQWLPESFNLPYPIRQASAGRWHSLVLLTNGDVYSAGNNDHGQLGYDSGDRNFHERIQISNIIQIVASYRSSYALNISGSVYSWGNNQYGQLGLGHSINKDTPSLIQNLENVKQIGGRHLTSFALTGDGKVFGWGSAGQAAFFIKEDGSTATCGRVLGGSGTYPSPTLFAEDIEFTFIDTSNLHALAIDVNQKLWSWGDGGRGRLGRGSTSSSTTPVEVKNIGNVITAAAGRDHSIAVDVSNDVWSWGTHYDGALGRTTTLTVERLNPGRITQLEGKEISGINAHYRSSFSYSSRSSGIFGQGKFSLINSEVQLYSTTFGIRTISLSYSTLYLNDVYLDYLKFFELWANSLVNVTSDSKIVSDDLTLTLNSSELYYDGSVDISLSSVSLIAINSRFHNDFDFYNIRNLDLSFSTFESTSSTQIIVGYFYCFHCQILGSSPLLIETVAKINSGNFASSLVVQESADNSSVTGQVQLANSMHFYSHVVLDDVSVSEFQFSPNGSITCHSDVLMRNDVNVSDVSFAFNNTLALFDSTLLIAPLFVLFDYQTMIGFGTIDTNILNFGRIYPSTIFTFKDNLSLTPSSIVSLQINNDTSSTQLIVELEFDTKSASTGANYTLIEAGQINGRFTSIINTCASLITTFYSDNSLIISLNDIVLDLNQVSYISPSGVDDPCCGTFDSPCASFKGVLERMGRKGKVYFHSGYYFLSQGFGKLIDVNWEVTGLGDVIIDGIDLVFLDAVSSSLTIQNLKVYGNNVLLKFVIHQSILIL
ncbi:hypothetical protein GEMRC1_008254 [Eukaryota sp. GEM-RC1]